MAWIFDKLYRLQFVYLKFHKVIACSQLFGHFGDMPTSVKEV